MNRHQGRVYFRAQAAGAVANGDAVQQPGAAAAANGHAAWNANGHAAHHGHINLHNHPGHINGHVQIMAQLNPHGQQQQQQQGHHHAHHHHHHHHHHPQQQQQHAGPSHKSNSSSSESSNSSSQNLRDLAFVRRRPIEGASTVSISSVAIRHPGGSGAGSQPPSGSAGIPTGMNNINHDNNKTVDFLYYNSSDSEDEDDPGTQADNDPAAYRVSCNFTDCLRSRETGCDRKFQTTRLASEYGTRHMLSNSMLKEYPVQTSMVNKVFCSQWLSHRQVVFGTKCNKIMVYDVNTRHMDQIHSLVSSENSVPPENDSGIHAIEINPSRTLLATGGKNSNDVAVYKLPTLDPICVGEGAHTDWIFDQTWIDDQFLVSGSRNGNLGLWRITDEMIDEVTSSEIPTYHFIKPLKAKPCKGADRVRSLCYNKRTQEVAVISLNGYIHCWNALRFKQIMTKKLPHTMENVCLSTDEDAQMYAVGSKANTDLLDARTLQAIKKIPSRNNGCGIRSVSFKGNILTIGTGIGLLLFWDLRAGKFLESTMNTNRAVSLKTSKGWMLRDENYIDGGLGLQGHKNMTAVYTHCYDESGTRLFAAGGPLPSGLKGNYIALFQ